MLRDDLGYTVDLNRPPRRVVSLVPSLTESVATSYPDLLVGATDWCTRPVGLDAARVRGTKNPDRRAVVDLRPDLVLANKEENRELDVRRLREVGVPVWVTDIETVPQALASLRRVFSEALQVPAPGWLEEAEGRWVGPAPSVRARVIIPVWRDPWMVIGGRTFTGDLARRLGLENAYAEHEDRYPTIPLEELDRSEVDLVLLPDEPYVFTEHDGPEAFTRSPTALVSGRLLTWYGPSLVEAHRSLQELAAR